MNEEKAKKRLYEELGKLTYERVKLTNMLNANAQRSNEIGTELEKIKPK